MILQKLILSLAVGFLIAAIGAVPIEPESNFNKLHYEVSGSSFPILYPKLQDVVKRIISTLNQSRVEDFVRDFSSFHNRHYRSEHGVQSQQWLLSQIQNSLQGYNGNSTVREFQAEPEYEQMSIIARIEGVDLQLKSEVVILGAHLDSDGHGDPSLSAPGADDNASGSAVVLETLRILVENGITPNRTIEFHWYAGEEVGMHGSRGISKEYRDNDMNVMAMLNIDCVGIQPPNTTDIGIYFDYGDTNLMGFLAIMAEVYLDYGVKYNSCWGCSDHVQWAMNGYSTALLAEFPLSNLHHTPRDTIDQISFEQVMEFLKLAVGFAIELGEPANQAH